MSFAPIGGFRPDPATIYSRIDSDQNGSVNLAEFKAHQPPRPAGAPAPTDQMKEAMFARIDTNQDGQVSLAEFSNRPKPPHGPGGFPPPFGANGAESAGLGGLGGFGGPGGLDCPPGQFGGQFGQNGLNLNQGLNFNQGLNLNSGLNFSQLGANGLGSLFSQFA